MHIIVFILSVSSTGNHSDPPPSFDGFGLEPFPSEWFTGGTNTVGLSDMNLYDESRNKVSLLRSIIFLQAGYSSFKKITGKITRKIT